MLSFLKEKFDTGSKGGEAEKRKKGKNAGPDEIAFDIEDEEAESAILGEDEEEEDKMNTEADVTSVEFVEVYNSSDDAATEVPEPPPQKNNRNKNTFTYSNRQEYTSSALSAHKKRLSHGVDLLIRNYTRPPFDRDGYEVTTFRDSDEDVDDINSPQTNEGATKQGPRNMEKIAEETGSTAERTNDTFLDQQQQQQQQQLDQPASSSSATTTTTTATSHVAAASKSDTKLEKMAGSEESFFGKDATQTFTAGRAQSATGYAPLPASGQDTASQTEDNMAESTVHDFDQIIDSASVPGERPQPWMQTQPQSQSQQCEQSTLAAQMSAVIVPTGTISHPNGTSGLPPAPAPPSKAQLSQPKLKFTQTHAQKDQITKEHGPNGNTMLTRQQTLIQQHTMQQISHAAELAASATDTRLHRGDTTSSAPGKQVARTQAADQKGSARLPLVPAIPSQGFGAPLQRSSSFMSALISNVDAIDKVRNTVSFHNRSNTDKAADAIEQLIKEHQFTKNMLAIIDYCDVADVTKALLVQAIKSIFVTCRITETQSISEHEEAIARASEEKEHQTAESHDANNLPDTLLKNAILKVRDKAKRENISETEAIINSTVSMEDYFLALDLLSKERAKVYAAKIQRLDMEIMMQNLKRDVLLTRNDMVYISRVVQHITDFAATYRQGSDMVDVPPNMASQHLPVNAKFLSGKSIAVNAAGVPYIVEKDDRKCAIM